MYEPDHERKDVLDCSDISWSLLETAMLDDSILDSPCCVKIYAMSR